MRVFLRVTLSVIAVVCSSTARADFADGMAAYDAGNYRQAYEIWLPLAEGGDPNAQVWVGGLYLIGEGVSKDLDKAESWAEEALPELEVTASVFLGGVWNERALVADTPQKEAAARTRACDWFESALRHSEAARFPLAYYELGWCYFMGDGRAADADRAFPLIRYAAHNQVPHAQLILGVMYFDGHVVEPNIYRSTMWLHLARQNGLTAADELLDVFYVSHHGAYRQGKDMARAWKPDKTVLENPPVLSSE